MTSEFPWARAFLALDWAYSCRCFLIYQYIVPVVILVFHLMYSEVWRVAPVNKRVEFPCKKARARASSHTYRDLDSFHNSGWILRQNARHTFSSFLLLFCVCSVMRVLPLYWNFFLLSLGSFIQSWTNRGNIRRIRALIFLSRSTGRIRL
jgi:hypothetical protein